jgi:hypothetical protein
MAGAPDLQEIAARGKEQYLLLQGAAENLLRKFDSCQPEELDGLLSGRQEIIDALQNIDDELAGHLEALDGNQKEGERRVWEEFRQFQQQSTRRILELDGLVVALAVERCNVIRAELAALVQKRGVCSAYEESSGQR